MKIRNFFPTIILTSILFLLWEYIVRWNLIPSSILPAPTEIAQALVLHWDVLLIHTGQTFLEAIIGLIIAIVLGLATAILLDMSAWLRNAVYPLIIISQGIPFLAWAPLLLIWFGFDITPKVIIVVLCCYFPVAISTIDGFAKIDPEQIKLLKSMKASYWQTLWLLRLPGSLPQFFSGVKLAAAYSVTGALVGEYVGAYQGLGIYMQEMAHAYAIAVIFAIIFITAFLTIFLFICVAVIEKLALPWYRQR